MLWNLHRGHDYCLPEKEMKERLRVTRRNSALTLIKTHISFLRFETGYRVICKFYQWYRVSYDGYLNGKR